MPTRTLDAQIDRLYQLPLDEFTAARNALAKETGSGEIKRLQKPPAAAWAINQVYWRRRGDYDAFSAAAAALKQAHAAVLTGKRADLRAAGKAHEDALDTVLKAALAILADAGQPATDATKQAIASTLRAMPSQEDEPGRLTRTLQPGGFELLAGLPIKGGKAVPPPKPKPAAKAPEPAGPRSSRGADPDARARAVRAKAIAAAKDALAEAQRVEKAADQDARREEFEAAKSARDAERAETRLAEARAALEAAQEALDDAEQVASAATRKRDAAARRVKETADALARARVRAEAARAELARVGSDEL
ncbi:MAG TPA: hypothetical protein VFJ02_13600 [Vicinamibacterales bacterium]|nr:hypothetical protein [Vicinamibacterales bacterium]